MNWITNTIELVMKTKPALGEMLTSIEDSLKCPPPSDIVVNEDRITLVWKGAAGSAMQLRIWDDKYTIHYTEYGADVDIAKAYQFKAVREFASKGYFFMHHDWINDVLLTQSLKSTILQNPDAFLINETMASAVHKYIEIVGCTIKPNSIDVKSPYVIELCYRGKTAEDSAIVTFTVNKDLVTEYVVTIMHLENPFLPMDESLFLNNFSLTKGTVTRKDSWVDYYLGENGGILIPELRNLIDLKMPQPSEAAFCTLTRAHVLTWRIDHKKAVTLRISTIRYSPEITSMAQGRLFINKEFESLERVAARLTTCKLDRQQGTYLTV